MTNPRQGLREVPPVPDNSSTVPLNRPEAYTTDSFTSAAADSSADSTDEADQPPTSQRFSLGYQRYSDRNWKWVPLPIRTVAGKVASWIRGPPEPRNWKIEPILPVVQTAPIKLMDRFVPRYWHRVCLYMALCAAWLLTFSLVMWTGQSASEISSWGQPQDISCGTVYWTRNNDCGLDGMDCRPFSSRGFPFRCPASCRSQQTLEPRAVGRQEIVYAPFVIGGPSEKNETAIYRGDSYICSAAIHAGIIGNAQGGCGVVTKIGASSNFAASDRNGISSIGFDSYFPMAYVFTPVECNSHDPRWALLAVSVTFTTVLGLFTMSPAAFFFASFVIAFWQVGLASDPQPSSDVLLNFTNILGKFLPSMFMAWVFYDKMGVRRALRGLTAQVEKVVLWLGGLWVGALSNYTFDFIPIQRLTGHDLQQQPGAIVALIIIVVILFCFVVTQIWFFQREGRLAPRLKLYGLFALAIVVCLVLPDLNLRIHHYIMALLLLPGTSMQTRPSLLYQGILLGLFINGIARWGFDPFLQTSLELQGDAQLGTALPEIRPPVINATLAQIEFTWERPPTSVIDGISILVNDVERYRAYFDDPGTDRFVWTRFPFSEIDNRAQYNEYFRFGWMQGTMDYDYTKAGTWDKDMNWVPMDPGPSNIKPGGLRKDETDVELLRR